MTPEARAKAYRFSGGDFLLWCSAAIIVLGAHGAAMAVILSNTPEPPAADPGQAAIMIDLAPEPEAVETDQTEVSTDTEDSMAMDSPTATPPPMPDLETLAEPPPDLTPPEPVQEPVVEPPPVEEPAPVEPPEEEIEPEEVPIEEPVLEEPDEIQEVLPVLPDEIAVPLPMARPKPPAPPEKKVVKKKAPPPPASKARSKAKADTTQSDRNAASKNSTGGASSSVSPARWQSKLLSHLKRYKRYPSASKSDREQGTVTVRFRIDQSGRVQSVSVSRSSGFSALDQAAIDMVRRASPVPAPPAGVNLTLVVPVRFDIR